MNSKFSPLPKFASFGYVALAATLFVGLGVTGCSSASRSSGGSSADRAENYADEKARLEKSNLIGPGFLLKIRQSADDQLSGEFKVGFKGTVKLPYDVTLMAAGRTTDVLAAKIAKAYAGYFKVKNNVSVEIASRTYAIEVRGLVSKPGVYNVKLDTSVEEIIAMSGASTGSSSSQDGRTEGQKAEYLRIVRPLFREDQPEATSTHWVKLADYFLQFDVRSDLLWRGGEQLFFQVVGDPNSPDRRARTIQVLGELNKPGEYPIVAHTDLLSYIAQAGGPTSTADLEHVVVIKRRENDSSSYNVTGGIQDVPLAPGDTILVRTTETKITLFERIAPILISTGGLVLSIILAVAL